ncbi:MAG: TonB-dependent receptor [Gammaproteobacteria bacterium]|nr:TonB-dependent receptor [Gammaproteobacteria bacterium]MBU1603314.1 TonB-dependent receptor [Gammaproteobacteria bacterium]MBU2432834.1 TonB-dependent receptor [Gammaproteobacteria bacterium]MBU2450077.1 TonB-dependent receptor [Gammaproteobacteria bacterium]
MKRQTPARSLLAVAISAAFAPAFAAETVVTTETVEVVGTTPLSGIGVPRLHLPANVQSLDDRRLDEIESQNIAEQLVRQVPAVTVNEVTGNPYQADLNYRGFTASPLLGTAQGLSVYVDGVRVNEPFGDTVNWDAIPNSAIAGIDLVPGSNPAFGLNTLGGALAMRTKSGFSHPGGKIEFSGGSFNRTNTELEYGGNNGTFGWYGAGDWFREDGWRDHSPSDVKQFFGKLSFRNAAGEADLTLTKARSKLIGNGLLPESMLAERRESIFTHPDETRNDLTQLALNGKLWLSDTQSLSASVYHRRTKTRTLNGDMNDDYETDYEDWVTGGMVGPAPDETGANNRTRTEQRSTGLAGQWNFSGQQHQLAVGASYDQARINFQQTQELGDLDASRGVTNLSALAVENQINGKTSTASLFLTDTFSLLPNLHLTASARYNMSHVTTFDELNRTAPNLDGDHKYRKLNPALGLSWQIVPALNAYAGFSQGNRVPTPIELGCADPANPCTLPNSMAADPYLKQVVARTLEAGLRGKLAGDTNWNAGLFRTMSSDDILFVGTSTSAGYFTNYGKTLRQGLELGLNGSHRRLDWYANYSWLQATFRSDACLLGANNSSRGTTAECTGAGQDDEILVKKGNHIPGLPTHSLKLGLAWRATDWLRLGGDVQAFSSQYVRGNENNQHQSGTYTDLNANTRTFDGPGKVAGYAILNLNAEARLGGGWQLFAKVNNVFDKHYATAGALAENPFVGGSLQLDPDDWRRETFVAPGAPRAAWLGVRYVFGGK